MAVTLVAFVMAMTLVVTTFFMAMTFMFAAFFMAVTLMAFTMSFAVATLVVTFAVALSMAASAALAVMAAATFLRSEFAVQAFGQFLLGSVTYRDNLSLEIQCLAGHRMIEVHGHGIFMNLGNRALDYHAGAVQQRNHFTYDQQVFPDGAVHLE